MEQIGESLKLTQKVFLPSNRAWQRFNLDALLSEHPAVVEAHQDDPRSSVLAAIAKFHTERALVREFGTLKTFYRSAANPELSTCSSGRAVLVDGFDGPIMQSYDMQVSRCMVSLVRVQVVLEV